MTLFFSKLFKASYPYFPDRFQDRFQELRDASFEEYPDSESIHLQEVQNIKPFNSNENIQQNFAHLSKTSLTDNMQENGEFYESHHEHPQAVQNRASRSNSEISNHFAHADPLLTHQHSKRREQKRQQAKRHNEKLSEKFETLGRILGCESSCTRLEILDIAIQELDKPIR